MNRWIFLIAITMALLALRVCANQSFEPFSQALVNYTRFFEVEEQIENMKNYSLGIKFNNTKEKYMFIFYPLMGKCVEEIKQEYEAVMSSFQNVGISGVVYGIAISTKIAIKAGFWKASVAGLLKTAALSTISIGALPIIISVGTASYLYSNYKRQELKQICSFAIKQVESMILKLELKELKQIKSTFHKNLDQKVALLNKRIQFMKRFPQMCLSFNKQVKRSSAKVTILRKYMRNFIKLTNYK